ncbi:MAG: RNA 2',3'-cyclic phosphodiesterase, partial [Rhodospirillales bacterium]|nr:RNA 2',3'-cyclic phosphodiesterase [Rhodospirillales bacterium]
MLRLFVAIEMPEDVAEALSHLRTGIPGARWVRPENMHLTLRFIGEVGEDEAHGVDSALSLIRAPAFSLRLAEVGCFKSGKRARALWAGAEAGESLTRLQAKVDKALVSEGLEYEARKFKPHVTLARLKETR